MRNKIILLATILCVLIINLSAQEHNNSEVKTTGDKGSTPFIALSSVSLSLGYYNPSMKYLNNSFLPVAQTNARFGGSAVYGGNIAFSLPLNLGARVSAWYWNKKVSGQGSSAFNNLKVNLTGLSLGAFYTYPKAFWGINPYAGIEGGALFIQDEFDANSTVNKKSGNDMIWTPFIGLSRKLSDKVVIGLEYGYVIGNYLQDVQATSGITGAKVPVDGHKIQLTIGYKFP